MKFRFGLRGLLILIGVATVILAVITSGLYRARRNVSIVNMLRNSGAFATFDDGSVPPKKITFADPDSAFTFRKISVVQNVLSDDVVESISGLAGLKKVQLSMNVTAAGLQQLSRSSSLEELRIDSLRISEDELVVLRDFRNLKRLVLSGPQFTDAALVQVAKVKKLQSLQLSGASVTDAGLQNLNGMRALSELDLAKTKISDEGLLGLRNLPSLKRINFSETQIKAATVAHIVMDVNGHPFGDWFPAQVNRAEGRTTLQLGGEQITDDAVPYLIRGLPQTTDIELSRTGMTSVGLLKFKELSKLKSLRINNADPFTAVEGLPELEELVIGSWGNRTVPQLNDLPKLTSLKVQISGMAIRSEALKPFFDFIADAPNLRRLEFDGPFDGAMAKEISQCGSLVELKLHGVALRDTEITHLANLKNLQSLTLARSQITDAGARQLDDLKQLRHLKLMHNQSVTDACLSALKLKPEEPDWQIQQQHQAILREINEARSRTGK